MAPSWTRAKWVLVIAGVTAACGPRERDAEDEDDDTSFVDDASDTSAAESDAQVVTSSLVSSSPGSLGLASVGLSGTDLGARDIGDGAQAIYFPRRCLTVEHHPAESTVTYKFRTCRGPNGLRAVTGDVTARYVAEPTHLHLELTATDLAVNGATVDWTATADISSIGADRNMTWKAQLAGTSAGGRAFARTNEHTVSWKLGEACFMLEGSSQGQVRGREIRSAISNFRRCRGGCPDAGGKIVVTNVTKGKSVELRYDGTSRATFVSPKGRVSSVALLCGS